MVPLIHYRMQQQQQQGQSHRLKAVQHMEEVEVNCRGKKTYQGCDEASICAAATAQY